MTGYLILAARGKKGHARQALAVARRLGGDTIVREVDGDGDPPDLPPGVELVLAAGRQSIAPARAIARRRGPRPVVAVLQPVAWRARCFDVVWAPLHDRLKAPLARGKRLETLTAPSAVTPTDRREGARLLADGSAALPRPLVGVLVGGASRAHRFGRVEAEDLAARLSAFAACHETGLLVSTSPRTGPQVTAVLRERLAHTPHLFVDAAAPRDDAPDPSLAYAGILERADAFIVTTDSFAMLSDAATTGKPIHGWRLPGGRAKFETLYRGLVAHGAMRWFDGGLSPWHYEPLDAAAVVADAVAARLPGVALPPGGRSRI
jgi:mitochondrial fission protein ELM1